MRQKDVGEQVCLLDGTRWKVQEVRCTIEGVASKESSENAEVDRIRVERQGETRWITPQEVLP
jgi:hypothetical protein